MHRRNILTCAIVLLCWVSIAQADILYQFSVNTSSISGTTGSLDFQFNPGPLVSQAASLDIRNFASNGALIGSPSLAGHATGSLTTAVTFDNGMGYNDYFQGFTFGSKLLFEVKLYGPAVNNPDGTATSGSAFAFSMFSDLPGTIPVLTTDTINGFASILNVNLDGSITVTNFSRETTIGPVSSVPEPSAIVLLGTALAGFAVSIRRKASGRAL